MLLGETLELFIECHCTARGYWYDEKTGVCEKERNVRLLSIQTPITRKMKSSLL